MKWYFRWLTIFYWNMGTVSEARRHLQLRLTMDAQKHVTSTLTHFSRISKEQSNYRFRKRQKFEWCIPRLQNSEHPRTNRVRFHDLFKWMTLEHIKTVSHRLTFKSTICVHPTSPNTRNRLAASFSNRNLLSKRAVRWQQNTKARHIEPSIKALSFERYLHQNKAINIYLKSWFNLEILLETL